MASVGTETGSAAEDSPGPRHLSPPRPDHHSQQESLTWRISLIDLDCLRHYLSDLYFRMIEISGYCQSFPANEPPPLSMHLPDFEEKMSRDPYRHQIEHQRGKGGAPCAQCCPNPQNLVPVLWQAGSTHLSWTFIIKTLLGTP